MDSNRIISNKLTAFDDMKWPALLLTVNFLMGNRFNQLPIMMETLIHTSILERRVAKKESARTAMFAQFTILLAGLMPIIKSDR